MSLSFNIQNAEIEQLLKEANNKGITILSASGNEANSSIAYPAFSVYVISVGCIENNGERWSFSNYGKGLMCAYLEFS